MRNVNVNRIKKVTEQLAIKSNMILRKDILSALKKAIQREKAKKAKEVMKVLIENAKIAKRERLAICQDTGVACVYLEIGQEVRLFGGVLDKAVNSGVKLAYRKGYFRNSIVDPISRKNTNNNAPAVIHTKIVKGSKIKVVVVPKGFGCENKNQIKMFEPTAGLEGIKKFVIKVVKEAGADACPPFVIGVGIGGTFEKAAELSKEALIKDITGRSSKLERELLKKINKLNIGPIGIRGRTTALGVSVLTHPTHIAGLPVAVSVGCHAMRSATKTI
ncbi:MAG: fumarate hydratase [Candidatus Omnitrophica bacterium]|nr:fumarate hydratase [Candidatus Omnitrophota bacterium]